MLSRVADSLYWINRYLERAENISRFLEVSEAMALDCPPGSAEPWLPLVDATGDRGSFDRAYRAGTPRDVLRFLLLDQLVILLHRSASVFSTRSEDDVFSTDLRQ